MVRKMSLYTRHISQHLAKLVREEKTRVMTYWDEGETTDLAICVMSDFPVDGVTTYSTAGVSKHEVRPGLGVEFIAARDSSDEDFAGLLATAGFFVVKDGWVAKPGTVFELVGSLADPDTELPHLLFVNPFLYQEQGLRPLNADERTIAWLMPVPISESELIYQKKHGSSELEKEFVRANIDLYDANRPPVV